MKYGFHYGLQVLFKILVDMINNEVYGQITSYYAV